MLMLRDRAQWVESRYIWWPTSMEDVSPHLSQASLITVMQCSDWIADLLSPYTFRRRPFHTALIHLAKSAEDLWSQLDSKSCRYEINRAKRVGCEVVVNSRMEQAFHLVNESIKAHRHRSVVSADEWRRTLQVCDVFGVTHDDAMIAAHVVMVDRPRRARLLFSATVDRSRHPHRDTVAPLNRYLHWFEFMYYKAQGIDCYDFGGIELNKALPIYSISRFKLSFGGDVVRENVVRLTGKTGLRIALRGAVRARHFAKTVRASVTGGRSTGVSAPV